MFTEVIDNLVEAVELTEVATADDCTSIGVAQRPDCFQRRCDVVGEVHQFLDRRCGSATRQRDEY